MTNQKTPVQGGATEEQVLAALNAFARTEHGQNGIERPYIQSKTLDDWSPQISARMRAALSASASAHPAGEHHDAEEREAESEDHAATATGERERLIDEAEAWTREQLPPSPWGDSHIVHRLIAALRGEGR